jgi:cyanophycin synthetase
VLSDPDVAVAVLETARGGIVRNGLGYDWCDVGVMTNIAEDHIGQDGIEDVNDILRIKALVAERVRTGGTLVLNADDSLLVKVPGMRKVSRVEKRIVWFANNPSNPVLDDALRRGETVYFLQDGWIVEATGPHRRRMVDAASVPLTFGGAAQFQIANVMAAVAACRAMNTGVAQIRDGLHSFAPPDHNPARANLFALGEGYILFDYGHNTAAFEAIAGTAANWPASRVAAVVGLPGDRADALIQRAACAAARSFDRVILREDRDPRGRRRGELAALLQAAIRREDPTAELQVILDENEAVSAALDSMMPGELVIVFCDDCDAVREALLDRSAVPAKAIEGRPREQVRVA